MIISIEPFLKNKREESDLHKKKLQDKYGGRDISISRIENSEQTPRRKTLLELLKALKFSLSERDLEFQVENLSNLILTVSEIILVFEIVERYINEKNLQEAEKVLNILEISFSKFKYEQNIKGSTKTSIFFYKAKLYFVGEQFEKALFYCKEAIDVSLLECGDERYIPDIFILAYFCISNMGLNNKPLVRQLIESAYFTSAAFGIIEVCEDMVELSKNHKVVFRTYEADTVIQKCIFISSINEKVTFDMINKFLEYTIRFEDISLNKLSKGICSPSTLSRFLNGEVKDLDFLILEAITQRLGRDMLSYQNYFIPNEEFEAIVIKEEINFLLGKYEFEKVTSILAEFKKKKYFKKPINRQFYLKVHCKILRLSDLSEISNVDAIYEAIRITIPEFEEKKIRIYRFTHQEIEIIKELALFFCKYNLAYGIKILEDLIASIEKYYVEGLAKNLLLVPVVNIYCEYLNIAGKYEKSLEMNIYCELKILKARKLKPLIRCLKNKGTTFRALGYDKKAFSCYALARNLEFSLKGFDF